ncbi:RluA family pseudouridine synthase [Spirochaeta lutea]|uniref:RluA family pseudouridine synthase n=1 Tax=Spirochaeta lutea TaxID=1480694 RepID=UPI001EE718E1|nr:RNA pseudouridine synthase [Spirochaeta lutea]
MKDLRQGETPPLAQRILYEDNHLLIVNKTCSELVQGDKTGDVSLLENLKEFIKVRDHKPGNVFLGLVHRLDRPTSGCVVYAKTSKALSRLTESFRDRSVQKHYWAITDIQATEVLGEGGEMSDWLRRNPKVNKSVTVPQGTRGAKHGVLRYSLGLRLDRYALWEVQLETGRHHQIRVQFAARGFPLRGDLKYGAARSIPGGGIALHARYLSVPHPTGQREVQVWADPRQVQGDTLWVQVGELLENLSAG